MSHTDETETGPHCIKCGRALTDPKSIWRRYGPVCWSKIQRELNTANMREASQIQLTREPGPAQVGEVSE